MKTKRHHLILKVPRVAVVALALLSVQPARAANIVLVSDANDPAGTAANTFSGFFPAGAGYTDSGFVTLLQNAGHNVIRFNQPNAQANLLTAQQIADLNTNDLLIMSRCVNSGALQAGQGNQWNTNITKPLIDVSAFHARQSRLGWFSANEAADATPMTLGAVLSGIPAQDAVVDYVFGGVTMNGTNTALPYDEFLDRNSTPVLGVPMLGGISIAGATYIQDNSTTTFTTNRGNIIAAFPAGTVVRTNNNPPDVLAGYRMFFSAGSRESTAYPNSIPLYTGRENLSPVGESIFLRAVEVALNNGAAPASDPLAPPGFPSQPVSVTALEGRPASFSVTVTGAIPRTVEWQRDIGDGETFATIPETTTFFSKSQYTLPAAALTDNGAKFRVLVTSPTGVATSEVATLTVTADTEGPTVLGAASLDGNSVMVYFNEPLDQTEAEFSFNYVITAASGSAPTVATLQPDRQSVLLAVDPPLSPSYSINISQIQDVFQHAITPVDVVGINYGLTGVSVGAPTPPGTGVALDANTFELFGAATTGGGGTLANDIQPTTENFQFAYRAVDGDFDARVRVNSISGPSSGLARLESMAKALLGARATADGNAISFNAFVTTAYPGDSTYGATARTAPGAATTSNFVSVAYAPNAIPATFPAWLRVTRAGDVFTVYSSSNGTDWTQYGSTTVAMGPTALVGTGASSHRSGQLVAVKFGNFQIIQTPAQPTILNPTYADGTFSGSFLTQNGISYRVVYKDDLSAATWDLLSTIPGNGAIQSFTDFTPHPNQRFYRVEILP